MSIAKNVLDLKAANDVGMTEQRSPTGDMGPSRIHGQVPDLDAEVVRAGSQPTVVQVQASNGCRVPC